MKKIITSFLILFFLFTNVIFVFPELGIMPGSILNSGYYQNMAFEPLKNLRLRSLPALAKAGVGGVAFAGTAIPVGNAIGKSLALRYDPSENDGSRLEVLVGGSVVNSGLFDWEWVPLIRFADGDSWACMSLTGGPGENEPQNILDMVTSARSTNNLVRWASYAPALGNTWIGFNLLLVDAMFIERRGGVINREIVSITQRQGFPEIPNYNDKPPAQNSAFALWSGIIPRENWNDSLQNIWNNLIRKYPEVSTYIFSDDGIPISYQISNGKIEFTGYPYYQFMKREVRIEFDFHSYFNHYIRPRLNTADSSILEFDFFSFWRRYRNNYHRLRNYRLYMVNTEYYELMTDLNNYVRDNYSAMKALNPVVYEAAERWCRWTALFRAVKEKDREEWSRFLNSVNAEYPYNPNIVN